MNKLLSIIMPVWNQAGYTAKCLDSLPSCGVDRQDYEVIVVDNGSTDETPSLLLDHPVKVDSVITNPKNLGVSKAWNQGVTKSSGEYICVINNDIIVFPNAFSAMLQVMAEGVWAAVPRHSAGPAPKYTDPDPAIRYAPSLLKGYCFMLSRAAMHEMYTLELAEGFSPANPLELALFDEQFHMAHYEDTDYDNRLRRQGHAPVEVQGAFIHHYGSRTLLPNLTSLQEHIQSNADKYHAKYPSP